MRRDSETGPQTPLPTCGPVSCRQVEELLQLDASNEEYQELAKSLEEVIELTEDLLREAAGGAAAPSQPGAPDLVAVAMVLHLTNEALAGPEPVYSALQRGAPDAI